MNKIYDVFKYSDIRESESIFGEIQYKIIMNEVDYNRLINIVENLKEIKQQRDELLYALHLALSNHGVMLLSDPPQPGWEVNRVDEVGRKIIKKVEDFNKNNKD